MSVTSLPKGLSTADRGTALFDYVYPDPTKTIVWWDDFHNYDASWWTVTEDGGTNAVQDEVGGVLDLVNAGADDNSTFLQWQGEESGSTIETFKITTSERCWFKARFAVSDATQSDFVIGLQITDTTPLAVSDGIFFQKDDGDTNLDFHVEKDSTSTDETGIHTMEDDTFVTAGFYYDKKNFHVYVNDGKVATVADDNLPNDEELTISFGVQNGEAAAKTFSVDYILAAQDRP